VDVADLPHTQPAWTGLRTAEDGSAAPPLLGATTATSTGIGEHNLTQEEIDLLTGTLGFMYIYWLGMCVQSICLIPFKLIPMLSLTIPILDAHRRIIALLGGKPRDLEGWKATTDQAAELMESQRCRTSFSETNTHHRRADEECPYACISCGISHGGGQCVSLSSISHS
jgi:hypothetical protein